MLDLNHNIIDEDHIDETFFRNPNTQRCLWRSVYCLYTQPCWCLWSTACGVLCLFRVIDLLRVIDYLRILSGVTLMLYVILSQPVSRAVCHPLPACSACISCSIRILDLTSNRLQEIPKEIEHLINVEILKLGQNMITELPNEIGNLVKIKVHCLCSIACAFRVAHCCNWAPRARGSD